MYDPRKYFSIAKTHSMIELKPEIEISGINDFAALNDPYTAVFEVTALNAIKYQWLVHFKDDKENEWHPVKGAIMPRLVISSYIETPYDFDGALFACEISNDLDTIYSAPAEFKIKYPEEAPTINSSLPENVTIPSDKIGAKVAEYNNFQNSRYAEYVVLVK